MGYFLSKGLGVSERAARTNSIEVSGQQCQAWLKCGCPRAAAPRLGQHQLLHQGSAIVGFKARACLARFFCSSAAWRGRIRGPQFWSVSCVSPCSSIVLRHGLVCSAQVGMQNSALGALLATLHFPDPLTPVPCAISACTHSIVGSGIAAYWRLSSAAVIEDGAFAWRKGFIIRAVIYTRT